LKKCAVLVSSTLLPNLHISLLWMPTRVRPVWKNFDYNLWPRGCVVSR
jgi:hypothetical protein